MRRGAGTRRALLTTLLSWNGFVNGFQQPAPTWTRAVAIPGFSPERPVGGGIQCRLLGPIFRRPYLLLSASTEAGGGDSSFFSQAQDLESLQSLFARYCDKQGLMTRSALRKVPAIADLLEAGDLLEDEFNDIWSKAPKFPTNGKKRIDVDSFVQVYRDIDDLFEDDGCDDAFVDEQAGGQSSSSANPVARSDSGSLSTSASSAIAPPPPTPVLVGREDDDGDDEVMEAELESIFESLCDEDKLVSKSVVLAWDEVSKLLEEGLLGEDEFEDLWKKTSKSPGSDDQLDVDGFLSFNVALDGLFDFDDEEMEDGEITVDDDSEGAAPVAAAAAAAAAAPSVGSASPSTEELVSGDGLSPEELFRKLSGGSNSAKLSRDDVLRWEFLCDAIAGGDLSEDELDAIFAKASKGKKALDKGRFVTFYKAIDDLFEDVGGDNYNNDNPDIEGKGTGGAFSELQRLKRALLNMLDDLSDPDLLPCGLDCSEAEQREILKLVSDLERQPGNMVRASGGDIDIRELNGSWDLLYSSSSAIRFNKGLSGLGASFPNGRFGGLRQVLTSTKFVSDVEYVERIEVNPSAASFDVTVTGDWDLRRSVSLFTGEPSLVMTIQPGRVTYGLTSMKADHWKSLGPMNMLDITFLDKDLRVMRGNTAVDTIFIFRRSTQ